MVSGMAAKKAKTKEPKGARTRAGNTQAAKGVLKAPRSAAIAGQGVSTGQDFAMLMSALMSDVIAGEISAGTCNAAVNAGGKLLKVVEMQMRYSKPAAAGLKLLEANPA